MLPATTAQNQVLSDVHVYYHGAETKYVGSIRVGFFEGAPAAQEMKANITLKRNESIANQSVTGIVAGRPGTYTMTFRLEATPTSGGSQPIATYVPVVVR